MSTEFFNDQWRIPSNENQNKVSNYSMDFNGASDFIDLGTDVLFDSTQGFSVSAWVNLDGYTASFPAIVKLITDKSATSNTCWSMGLSNTAGYTGVFFGSSSDFAKCRTDGNISGDFIGAWKHVCLTFDGVDRTALSSYKIYVDGSSVALVSAGVFGATSTASSTIGWAVSSNYWNGKIDQLTIFDYALSQDQVIQLGAEGYAFNFNGSSQYINAGTGLGNSLGTYTGDASVSLWFKAGNTASNDGLFSITAFNDVVFGNLRINIYNNLLYFVSSGTGNYKTIPFTDTTSWHHLVCIFKSGDITNSKIYLDGVDKTTTDIGTFPSSLSFTGLKTIIGAYHSVNQVFQGELSNVAIFNTGLSYPDVQTLYNSGRPLTDMSSFTSLQGWWKLNQTATFNSNWTIPDASSNSNTGTSVGMNASNLVESNINGELIANPMATSPKPIAYYQLGDQSVSTGPTSDYLVPNNSLSDYVFNFSTNNESINLGNSFNYPSVVADPWTISFWIKPTSATSDGIIFSGYSIANNRGFYVNMRNWPNPTPSDRRLQCLIRSNSNTYTAVVTPSLALNEWTHVAICYGGGGSGNFPYSFTIYFNNSPVSLVVSGGNLGTPAGSVGPNDNKYIGQLGNNASYLTNTELSELSFLKYKLSANQVDTLYNNGKPGDISSLNPFTSYELNASEIFNSTSTEWSVDNNVYPSTYQSSLNFNGSSDYIDCGTGSVFNLNQVTISAWINDNQTTNYGTVAGIRKSSDNSVPYMIIKLTAASKIIRFRATQSDGTDVQINSNPIIEANTWYHVVGVADGSNIKMYVNGELQTATNSYDGTLATPDTDFEIGKYPTAASLPASYHWYGQISNVALFNTGLSQSQVTTLYNNGTPEASISHSPVSWWKLDNTTTGLIDNGSASNNGTNNGATEYTGFVNALAGESSGMDSSNLVVSDLQQTSGYSPYALNFDGTSDYLDFNNASGNLMTNKNAISISGWFKLDSNTTSSVFSNWHGGLTVQYLLRYNTGAGLGIQWYIYSNSNTTRIDTNYFPNVGDWVHVVAVKDPITNGGQSRVYINSVEYTQNSTNLSVAIANNSSSDLIGTFKASNIVKNPMNGSISNVAYWTDTALTQADVTEIYNQGVPSNLNTFSGTSPNHWLQIGSNSSYNSGAWTCLDEIGNLNAVSAGSMTNDDIVDGPGYSASGLGTSSIDIKGDAPYSSANGLSENMDVLDRTTDVAPT